MKGCFKSYGKVAVALGLRYNVRVQGDIQTTVGHPFRAKNNTHGFRGVNCQMPDETPDGKLVLKSLQKNV